MVFAVGMTRIKQRMLPDIVGASCRQYIDEIELIRVPMTAFQRAQL